MGKLPGRETRWVELVVCSLFCRGEASILRVYFLGWPCLWKTMGVALFLSFGVSKTQVVILGSIHSFRNCGPGKVVWLLAVNASGYIFRFFSPGPCRSPFEAQLLSLLCPNSKQLHSPVGFALGRYTCLENTPTLSVSSRVFFPLSHCVRSTRSGGEG